MKKVLALVKFFGFFILMIALLVGIIFSYDKSTEISVIVISYSVLFLLVGVYLYYLIKTGIWNWKNQPYSINVLIVIGHFLHFFSTISLLFYTQYIISSKEESRKLLFTTLPFFILGIGLGLYDAKQFYKSWKLKRSA